MSVGQRGYRMATVLTVAAVLVTTVFGCSMNPVSGWPELTLVSTDQEKKIGTEEAKKVEEEMGLLPESC